MKKILDIIIDYVKEMGIKRFVIMLVGNILLGLGIGIFRLSSLGNDPFSGMNIAVSMHLPLSYPNYQLIVNFVLFIIQIIWGRHRIGAGTVVNAFLLGYIADAFYKLLLLVCGAPELFLFKILIMIVGVLICSLGLSMYQVPNVGVAPYDALSLIINDHFKKIPYFWCRMFTDALCALVCFLAGGIVGIGTLVATFGFGPFIHFFNKNFTEKIVKPMKKRK